LLVGTPISELAKLRLPTGEQVLFWAYPNEGIGHMLYWYGFEGWEKHSVSVFARLAREAKVILDIGANTGIYSLVACAVNPQARVICFEPVPATLAKLKWNLALNGFSSRCDVHAEALSDHSGTETFQIPEDDTMASLGKAESSRAVTFSVQVERGDALVPAGTPVDLIKIDVEGFEVGALRGLLGVLEECHPAILFECLPDGPAAALEALLGPLGYRFQTVGPRLNGESLGEASDHIDPTAAAERNFLAVYSRAGGIASAASA
jgi:FkbM family methyltransferase